jgi:hypothetical protein
VPTLELFPPHKKQTELSRFKLFSLETRQTIFAENSSRHKKRPAIARGAFVV